MKTFSLIPLGLAALAQYSSAAGVTGKPEGFAADTTGGGNAAPVYPKTIQELTSYLTDNQPRVIMLTQEFNFIGSEGRKTATGCRPASNTCGSAGQDAINAASWCTNGNAGKGSYPVQVNYDQAAINGINVGSNKSLVGVGTRGVLRGKGLRIANGARNVIIQNIHITELNPQYIWGGDAITLAGTDLVWVDHVKVSRIGRQMFVAGMDASNRVTLSYNDFDGNTTNSASCDGRHYWALYLTGANDQITMKGNYIHQTSGRSPKIGGNTLLHAVNNYWADNSGHAFDLGSANAKVCAEGNVFQDVHTPLLSPKQGQLFSSPDPNTNAVCKPHINHACQVNTLGGSGAFSSNDQGLLSGFDGKPHAAATPADAKKIQAYAGVGKI